MAGVPCAKPHWGLGGGCPFPLPLAHAIALPLSSCPRAGTVWGTEPTPWQAVGTPLRQGCLHHVTQHTPEGQYLGGSRAGSGVKDPQFLVLLR